MMSATDRPRTVGSDSSDVKERALEFAAAAREQVSGGTRGLRQYVVKEPTRALGVALVLGVIVGWLIKRR